MKYLNERNIIELSLIDSQSITGGKLTTGPSSLLRNALALGMTASHAIFDFAAGFITRFTANSTK